jgi:hypothetical protein
MLLSPAAQNDLSPLLMIEGGGTMIAFAVAFAWPGLGSSWSSSLESAFARLARRQGLAVAAVGLATLVLRLAMLPLCPIPLPFAPDDFSNLLASDTFAHGRLTNPTPALWTHFESIHITMQPTYMSMYFPAQGLVMAAGKVLFGSPWFGILIVSALMCASICWMLQAWLPPGWALLGGILAMLRLGLFSYWVNTYTGGGLIAGLGGALVLGALPRLTRTARIRYGMLMAAGIALLALTRPYEGVLLCLPVAAALGHWACFGKNRPGPAVLLRRAALPLALIVATLAWLGYYDYRAFGSPLTLPYTVNRATYAMAPYFVWQSPRPEPHYRHQEMRRFYYESELSAFLKSRPAPTYAFYALLKIVVAILFFAGFALLPPLIMVRRMFLDRRIRFLVQCVLVFAVGMLIQIYMIPHYLAPFTAAFYAIGLQCMRHLRVWKPEGRPAGVALVRLIVMFCVGLAGLRVWAAPLGFKVPEWPPSAWADMWYGPELYGTERAQIETRLDQLPGKQLVIVRYSSTHNTLDEWVYNRADIAAAKVIWAREMDDASNRELLNYYPDRKAWLVQVDAKPATLTPYPAPALTATAMR